MRLPVMPPVQPMLAKVSAGIPPGHHYEPKWDGFRAIVFRDGDEVEIGSRNERPMTRYFPEVAEAIKANLPERCVVDGEIVIAGPHGGLDFWALQQRLHPAASRVNLLAGQTPASFIAFDLLALGDDDLTQRPFAERRAMLERALEHVQPPVHLTPLTQDLDTARRWYERFEGAGLDGLIAKAGDSTYQPNKRVMVKVKHVRTMDCVCAGYRVHKSGPGRIGSLLLGLYHDESAPASRWADSFGGLAPIGVAASFPMALREQLFEELQPLRGGFEDHPWRWAATEARPPEGGSRWAPDKDLSFVPLRLERVVEVRYEHMDGGRLRHPARFVRWRPDREPASCGYSQLERPERYALSDVLSS